MSPEDAAEQEALGRSQGGFSTKVHMACDALGNPLAFLLTPGQKHERPQAEPLLAAAAPTEQDVEAVKAVLADKGYDADALIEHIVDILVGALGGLAAAHDAGIVHDEELYKDRNKVERLFGRLKHYRRIATRYEKTATSYMAMLHLASAMVWLL